MNFRRGYSREEPEINLIPMIDVLLVILIFLMVTTSYSKFSGLEINLPTADAPAAKEPPAEIDVAVSASGEVMVNKSAVGGGDIDAIVTAMKRAAGTGKEPLVVISADAKATHQRVVDVMQAAQQAGLPHISFATQQTKP
ncbi:biopolymer transporter ExbD [Denitratisoma sp. DHT3]|uniref:ExbD/TolR family protein n=1 Tax=Denitratisoma sp. DHT3 TaxID=1981880 RepID=UPI0011983422|nr:biopolymer transporter ExbD [Denitratisoma sp. DHT3]QDX82521.1 biopolymer transporter ExbD [Denitratisoma sp. DHT3]